MTTAYRTVLKIQAATIAALMLLAGPVSAAQFQGSDIGKLETVTAGAKDTLSDLAEKEQVGYAQLVAANPGVDPWLPGNGTKIVLPNWHLLPDAVHQGLVLNVGELLLYYFPADGSAPTAFPIGIGREGLNTPLGTTTIVSKTKGPSWRPTPRMRQEDPRLPAVVEPGPDNPLGAYALYLGWPSYRLHGTNHEKAIGRRASSGCVRLYKADIEWLFNHVPAGMKLTSVNQPVKMGWIDGSLYLEAEPNDIQIDEIEYKNRQITVEIPDGVMNKIRTKAGKEAERIDWEQVRKVMVERTGIPTKIMKGGKDAAVVVEAKVTDVEAAKNGAAATPAKTEAAAKTDAKPVTTTNLNAEPQPVAAHQAVAKPAPKAEARTETKAETKAEAKK